LSESYGFHAERGNKCVAMEARRRSNGTEATTHLVRAGDKDVAGSGRVGSSEGLLARVRT